MAPSVFYAKKCPKRTGFAHTGAYYEKLRRVQKATLKVCLEPHPPRQRSVEIYGYEIREYKYYYKVTWLPVLAGFLINSKALPGWGSEKTFVVNPSFPEIRKVLRSHNSFEFVLDSVPPQKSKLFVIKPLRCRSMARDL